MSNSSDPGLPQSVARYTIQKSSHGSQSEPATPITLSDRSLNSSPPSMQDIQRPLPAAVLRTRVVNYPSECSRSQSSIVSASSEPSVLPSYSDPEADLVAARRRELNTLRTRYQHHQQQYYDRRRAYIVILVVLTLAAGAFVLLAFMVDSPHIIMALGVVLIVVFVCIAHRITMHRDVLRKERLAIDANEQLHGLATGDREFPLPDDQYLVITQNSHGHERRTLICGPPDYDNATTVPPAYLPKLVNSSEETREMEEIRVA